MLSLSMHALMALASLPAMFGGNEPRAVTRSASASMADVAEDPNVRCAANRATSNAIPFKRVNEPGIERVIPSETPTLVYGPRMFAVVTDSAAWPAVWRAAVDSVKPFPVAFGDAVLVLAATNTFGTGPTDLEIVSIRECRRTSVVVVFTLETRPGGVMAVMMRNRGFDLVRVPGRLLADQTVLFDQRVRFRSPRG